MDLITLRDLFVEELQDLYDAEHQIIKALPKMIEKASASELKETFEEHLEESKNHVERLKEVFQLIGLSPSANRCQAMAGLIAEGEELLEKEAEPEVMDAGIIAMAQRVEHYEMAGYGAVRSWSRQLGFDEAADLLQDTLDEEGHANKKLIKLAEGSLFKTGINERSK